MNNNYENQKRQTERQPGHSYPQRPRQNNSAPRFGHARDSGGGRDREMGTKNPRYPRDLKETRESKDSRNSRGAKDYQGQPQQGYHHPGAAVAASSRYAPRYRAEETLEDIRTDIQRLEKEIDLEIKEIKSLRLGL